MDTHNTRKNPRRLSDPEVVDSRRVTIEIPARLAKRIEKYSKNNGISVLTILVEALDEYLCKK